MNEPKANLSSNPSEQALCKHIDLEFEDEVIEHHDINFVLVTFRWYCPNCKKVWFEEHKLLTKTEFMNSYFQRR